MGMAVQRAERELKLERWLVALSERLTARGLAPRLLYTDKARGDRLALVVATAAGLVELQVHRAAHDEGAQGKAGAVLVLFAESKPALQGFASALGDLHHETPRIENERRKFYHRIERMAEHLLATFELRSAHFPVPALVNLRGWLGDASPMTGVEATFRTRDHEPEATRLAAEPDAHFRSREARRYLARYAARVAGPGGARAAPFVPATNGFRLGFVPAAASVAAAGAMTAASGPRPPREEEARDDSAIDAVEVGVDLAELGVDVAAGGCTDWGGIDLPDCDFIDVPDCGGCDCSF
jgi:hypothetical protein